MLKSVDDPAFPEGDGWPADKWRGLMLVISASAVLLGLWVLVAVARRLDDPLFPLGPPAVVVLTAAVLLLICGGVAVARSRRPDVVVPALLASLLSLFGILALLSIGFFILAGSVLAWFAVAAMTRRRPGAARGSLAAAAAVALGLALAFFAWPRPLVECRAGGAAVHTPWYVQHSAGSSHGVAAAGSSGQVTMGGQTWTYHCSPAGELIDIRLGPSSSDAG
jgi:hypothetical protein